MSVTAKFSEFKKEITETFGNPEFDLLEINRLSAEELFLSGYFVRKIQSFLHLGEFSDSEINEFFCDHCSDYSLSSFSNVPPDVFTIPAIEFIRQLKHNCVCKRLADELYLFVEFLKEENISRN